MRRMHVCRSDEMRVNRLREYRLIIFKTSLRALNAVACDCHTLKTPTALVAPM